MIGTDHNDRSERKIANGANHIAITDVLRTIRLASRRDPPDKKIAEPHPINADVRKRATENFAVTPHRSSQVRSCFGGVGHASQATQPAARRPAKEGAHLRIGRALCSWINSNTATALAFVGALSTASRRGASDCTSVYRCGTTPDHRSIASIPATAEEVKQSREPTQPPRVKSIRASWPPSTADCKY